MNATNIIKQIVPKREAFFDSRNLTTSLFIVFVLALFGYLLYLTISAPEIVAVPEFKVSTVRENPELSAFRRFTYELESELEASFLARNPEVGIANRYTPGNAAALAKASILSQNPELSAYDRFAADATAAAEYKLLSENPEIMTFRRYLADH